MNMWGEVKLQQAKYNGNKHTVLTVFRCSISLLLQWSVRKFNASH